jgi:phosphonopyruvate decarboxylase
LADNEDEVRSQLAECYRQIKITNAPLALLVRSGTIAPYAGSGGAEPGAAGFEMSREGAIEEIILASSPDEIFVSTTGMISRELYELREKHHMPHDRDFLMVGAMGHASSLALSLALQKPGLWVNCLDGDGAALMHLGALAAIGALKPVNLRHFVLNNGAHDSVGGQPTIAHEIDLPGMARAAGYAKVYPAGNLKELRLVMADISASKEKESKGHVFVEIKVRQGNRKDLGRPQTSPQENKNAFRRFMAEGNK